MANNHKEQQNAVSLFLHFQRLAGVENVGTSVSPAKSHSIGGSL